METTRGSVNTIPQQNGDAALSSRAGPSTASRRRRRARCSRRAQDLGQTRCADVVLGLPRGRHRTGEHLRRDGRPLTDGTYLHDLAAAASNGGTSAPTSQGTLLQTNTWQRSRWTSAQWRRASRCSPWSSRSGPATSTASTADSSTASASPTRRAAEAHELSGRTSDRLTPPAQPALARRGEVGEVGALLQS